MPKFAANLTTMFHEYRFEDRFQAAHRCGFQAVEILSPYDYPIDDLNALLTESNLDTILINIAPGAPGEFGTAAVQGREKFFEESFDQALNYADGLNASMIHVLVGKETAEHKLSAGLCIENLRRAADLAAKHDITLLLEPLNTKDVPGYFHTTNQQTAQLIESVDRQNVKLQFDFYHRQIMEGNLAAGLTRYLDIIGHVQFSSLPGRHEPQFGEVNTDFLFEHLDNLGYTGWVGCEYTAAADTTDGLNVWGKPWGLGQADD